MCLLGFDCQTKSILCKFSTSTDAWKRCRRWVYSGGIFYSGGTISGWKQKKKGVATWYHGTWYVHDAGTWCCMNKKKHRNEKNKVNPWRRSWAIGKIKRGLSYVKNTKW